jgi:hypothetical protein
MSDEKLRQQITNMANDEYISDAKFLSVVEDLIVDRRTELNRVARVEAATTRVIEAFKAAGIPVNSEPLSQDERAAALKVVYDTVRGVTYASLGSVRNEVYTVGMAIALIQELAK